MAGETGVDLLALVVPEGMELHITRTQRENGNIENELVYVTLRDADLIWMKSLQMRRVVSTVLLKDNVLGGTAMVQYLIDEMASTINAERDAQGRLTCR